MKKVFITKLIIVFLMLATQVCAQRQKKQNDNNLSAFREFVDLGKWYLNIPLQIKVHFTSRTTPSVAAEDDADTDMLLYYGQNDFYMQAGDMEQIVNDSLTVLVNNGAKMIKLLPNPQPVRKALERSVSLFMPDSSIEKLVKQYSIEVQEERGIKKMIVSSIDKVSGTEFNKETMTISYQVESRQPISYIRTKRSFIPVDSLVYTKMEHDPAYTGRLLHAQSKSGSLFLVIKEKTTNCTFLQVTREQQLPPVLQPDRIVRMPDGEYKPAKKYEEYLVSAGY